MNPVDWIILGIVVSAAAAALTAVIRRRKRGGGCGCGCSDCSECCGCPQKDELSQKKADK